MSGLSSWFSIDRILQPVVFSDGPYLQFMFVRIHSFLATSRSRGECTHPKESGFDFLLPDDCLIQLFWDG
jgi:hypothetical protein